MNDNTHIQLTLISFGAILGVILSFIATEISSWRQRKHALKLKNKDLQNEVIGDSLKFLFKQNDIINDLQTNRQLLEKLKREESAGRVSYLKKDMLEHFDNNIKANFFSELMFHSFQLKRLDNQHLWNDFEALMNITEEIIKMYLDFDRPLSEIINKNNKYTDSKKKFIEKCLGITKIKK